MTALPPIPRAFAEATLRREGGAAWLASVPERVESLCRAWSLSLEGAVWHGHWGLVFSTTQADRACVLKVTWPGGPLALDAAALRAWNGHGAAELLAVDEALDALLLERLDASRSLAALPVWEALDVGGGLLRRLAIPAPRALRAGSYAAPHEPRLARHALTLAANLGAEWEAAGRPFPRRVLDRACDLAAQLAQSPTTRLIHGDLHPQNILAGTREAWQAIDPRVQVGDPEYGAATLLLRHLAALEAAGHGAEAGLRALMRAAHLNPDLAHAWTLVRTAEYWLWAVQNGLTEDPARCARIVDGLR